METRQAVKHDELTGHSTWPFEPPVSSLSYCRTRDDGSIFPIWEAGNDDPQPGQFEVGATVADRYLLKKKLGQGAMGRVFLAHDASLDRQVAIKVVAHERKNVQNLLELQAVLRREAKLGASLNHRCIAAVYDFGVHDNKSYTVFEFIEGETLREILRRRGALPLAEVIPILSDLAAALDFAHEHGVVHRDLKPENTCFTLRGELKVLDLGLASEIRVEVEAGKYSGTPAYSSPEQAACRPTDGRSDQYALALIVFEMLTGRQAFQESDPLRMLRMQIEEPPPRPRDLLPELPAHVEQAILRALSKQPDERFASCQDFARQCSEGAISSADARLVSTPNENRLGFYIAHVAEESQLARQIGDALERKRYSCWYYGRDAIPGVSYISQSRAAMDRSQGVVLLISRSAVSSADFARELEHARHTGCPLLPFLIDISREEIEKLAPTWCRTLGASPMIELRRSAPLRETIERIALSAKTLSIEIDKKLSVSAAPSTPARSGSAWATDANQIDIGDLERVLFRNDVIDSFLQGTQRYFVSATKGFGKTLLLTCKRQALTRSSAASEQRVVMVPEGRPYLDFMSELRSLSAKYEQPLSSVSFTKRIWSAAIRIAAISHHPGVLHEFESAEIAEFPERIQHWLAGAKIQPTVVFKELTALSVGELNHLIDATENFLDQKLRQIHGGLYFFVDKVDQALRHLSRDAWVAIQAGLIEAAWETMNANSHIKVYASIRQEAFSNYESDIKANLFAATTDLRYSEEELRALIDQLARCYEGSQSFADFLGLNVVRHARRPAPEDSFQYMRRHTCGRPRDLVAIAAELSSKRSSLNEKRLRDVVQHTTASVVVSNIFDEVRVFLTCLTDRDTRLRLLSTIPQNILTKPDAVHICEQFNGLAPGTLEHYGEDSAEIFHPFRDLYAAGLLGVVERDQESGVVRQRFRRPHDPMTQWATQLPDSPVFLLHPALDQFIRSQFSRNQFLQYQHITVGENLVWEPYYVTLMQIERQLHRIDEREFVESAHQVVKWVQSFLNSGRPAYARIEIETSADWQTLRSYEHDNRYSEALLWLDELLNEL